MNMNHKSNKRGQVTLFIIIALVIVVLAVLIYLFYPGIKTGFVSKEENPNEYMSNCLQETIDKNAEEVALQGGSAEPEHYIAYKGEEIEYLCYTEEYYKTCVMQQPMLKNHIEEELKNQIQEKAKECLGSMEENFRDRGYDISVTQGDFEVELLPKQIRVMFDNQVTLEKEEAKKYNSIIVSINNNLYELIGIANSILKWETKYGEAETTLYMNYYPEIKVQKKKQSDGSTIYIITDRKTQDKLQFASRSVAWPPGYGTDQVLVSEDDIENG